MGINAKATWQTALRLLSVLMLATASLTVAAQTTKPSTSPITADQDDKPLQGESRVADEIEEEMRKKREIKAAEKQHEENVNRAREVSEIGKWLLDFYKKNNSWNKDAEKKLERMEKLAKRIRSDAGGSEDEGTTFTPTLDRSAAVSRLANVSNSLREKVEKTPRHVVSATVIDETNILLSLVRFVRGLDPQSK